MVPEVTARAQLEKQRFLEGIGAHCPSAFPFLSAKIPGRCRRSRGRAIQRGRGPARLRRGHELGGRVGPAHQTAPGSASRVRIPRTACALVCLSARAGLLLLPGLTAGVGVVQVARGVAELHGVEEAVAPARVKRLGRRAGGAKSCRRRSPSCLGGADSPSCGLRASGHLGIKLPPESMTEGITGAFSSGCILVGAASVPRTRYPVSFDMPGARGLPARTSRCSCTQWSSTNRRNAAVPRSRQAVLTAVIDPS